MIKCPGCGEENPPKFKLCGYCGTPLATAAPVAVLPAHEIRKTVTIVFTDLKDSTALGETLDSEALHEVKERYFNAMAAEIKRHGGKIEKYIGDAIMAVFGLPRAHEYDALRAVRAAAGMLTVLHEVNAALVERFGVRLANRTGVNTGEVVASDDPTADQKLATGDAVNVTARLEAAAPADEIYIGEVTWRLVRDAVEVEAVAPLTLKGKAQPVPAYRLIKVHGEQGNVRRHDTPVVGREVELTALQTAFDEAVRTRKARLVSVIGDAGVGKSKLVREFMNRMHDAGARIVMGRCLPYGDGITFWPLREMVVTAAGIRQEDPPELALEKLTTAVGESEVAQRLASAAGFESTAYPLHEVYWAARKLLEHFAADKPVVAMIDDIHWAEPAFLDLLVNVLETIEDAPVLLLATARNELLESNADWGQRDGARRLQLQPLGNAAAAQIVANLLGSSGLPEIVLSRIVTAAEGNPLYVEQVLSMLIDNGALRKDGARWVSDGALDTNAVPPTIHALLEARLDRLERTERAAAEPAAVIGMEFQRPAVEALAPEALRNNVATQLEKLSTKQFIRHVESAEKELLYRFHHHLVRETVYNGLLKRARAKLHTEFVRWADKLNADNERALEFEAILGYHLEQAYRYLGELGPLDAAAVELGCDGARRLSSAGSRALERGDMHAAANLLRRASNMLGQRVPQRARLLPLLAESLIGLGDFAEARSVLDDSRNAAEALGDRTLHASSRLLGVIVRVYSGESGEGTEDILDSVLELIPQLERDEAHNELATAWRLLFFIHAMAGRYGKANEAAEHSIHHARAVGNERLVQRASGIVANTALIGPTPVPDAIRQCEGVLASGLRDRQVEGTVTGLLSQLYAMNEDGPRARELYRRGRSILRDLGQGVLAAASGMDVARVELLIGDAAAAEAEVRADFDFLTSVGETFYCSALASVLSRIVRQQGRLDEALQLTLAAEAATAADDRESQVFWRAARAPILALQGKLVDAEALARGAAEMMDGAEAPSLKADALIDLATVLHIAGKAAHARAVAQDALALYRLKGNKAAAALTVRWIAEKLGG